MPTTPTGYTPKYYFFQVTVTAGSVARNMPVSLPYAPGINALLFTPAESPGGTAHEIQRHEYAAVRDVTFRASLAEGDIVVGTELAVGMGFYMLTGRYYNLSRILEAHEAGQDIESQFRVTELQLSEMAREFEKIYGQPWTVLQRMGAERVSADKVFTPREIPAWKTIPCPTLEKDGFYVSEDTWQILCRNAIKGKPTILVGPPGTGKTEILRHLSNALGRRQYIIDMGGITEPHDHLLGKDTLVSRGRGSTTVMESSYQYAMLPLALRDASEETPILIHFDEFNRATSLALNILFPLLDHRGYISVPSKEGGEIFSASPKTVALFATANIGNQFTGTGLIDAALYDRFFPVELAYPPKDIEKSILIKMCVTEPVATQVVNLFSSIRESAKTGAISTAPSTRHLQSIGELIADGFTFRTSCELVLYPLFEDVEGGERTIIKSLVQNPRRG